MKLHVSCAFATEFDLDVKAIRPNISVLVKALLITLVFDLTDICLTLKFSKDRIQRESYNSRWNIKKTK